MVDPEVWDIDARHLPGVQVAAAREAIESWREPPDGVDYAIGGMIYSKHSLPCGVDVLFVTTNEDGEGNGIIQVIRLRRSDWNEI